MMTDTTQTIYNKALYDRAQKHNQQMKEEFPDEIEYSIKNSKVYRDSVNSDMKNVGTGNLEFQASTTSVAVMNAVASSDDKVAALNYASFTRPGGGFIKGSKAQEEMLCHDSTLYNVLGSKVFQHEYNENYVRYRNNGLYTNFAIYSPDIIFVDEESFYKADVITCASPNWSAAKDKGVSYEENLNVFSNRVKFMLDVAVDNGVNTIILGAWGCGVFGQKTEDLAKIFKDVLPEYRYYFNKIIFAIPDNSKLQLFKTIITNDNDK